MASSTKGDSEYVDVPDWTIIHEIYEGENAHEAFENEFERALDSKYQIIVIEPPRLAEETARWIGIGNCLHKTAIFAGLGSIFTSLTWKEKMYISTPLGIISLFCSGLYTLSWATDPCVKYQVETDTRQLAKLPLQSLTNKYPLVLVRKDDTKRRILHISTTLIALGLISWKVFESYQDSL